MAEGVTFTQAEQWHPWGGIVVAGTGTDPASVTLDDVTVEHADAGLTVYQFGTADVTESTFQDNGIGLDVRSNSGVTVSGSAFDGNGYGVTSGFIEVFGSYDLCISALCRSAFTLFDTFVTDNGATGIYAHNTEARIELTEISGNGSAGLAIANADVNPFQNNVIEGNGAVTDGFGVSVLSGGDFYLSPPFPNPDFGVNRITGNATTELWLYSGSYAFIGDGSEATGFNSIYDTGGRLIANHSGAKVQAEYTFWGTGGAPPAFAFYGPVNDANPLDCDYTITPPNCIGTRISGAGLAGAGGGAGRETMGWLGAEIRRLRAEVAAGPGEEGAAGVLRSLYALQRLDRADTHGERRATMALLSALRNRLGHGALPAPLRATAEAALAAEVSDALLAEDYDAAGALLLGYGDRVEGESIRRELALSEAVLDARAGRYAEAAARVAAVAASETDEGAARELSALADAYARRAGQGEGRVAATPGSASASASAAVTASPAVLSTYPNPFNPVAVVTLEVASPGEASVTVYDVLGRRVAALHEGPLEAGRHAFRLDGAALPSGVYLVRATLGDPEAGRALTQRVTLLK